MELLLRVFIYCIVAGLAFMLLYVISREVLNRRVLSTILMWLAIVALFAGVFCIIYVVFFLWQGV